jgi:hypothetical protein
VRADKGAQRSSHVLKELAAPSVRTRALCGTWRAHASHAGSGEVAQSEPPACPSQGDEVHGFPERTWSAGVSPPAEVRKVCLVDLAIAGRHPHQRTVERSWLVKGIKCPRPARRPMNLLG